MKLLIVILFSFLFSACSGDTESSKTKRKFSTPFQNEVMTEEEINSPEISPPTTSTIAEEEIEPPVIIIADPPPEPEPELEFETEIAVEPENKPEVQPEPMPPIIDEPEIEETIEKVDFDYSPLEIKGIHIVGRSTLHELRNPAAIYCTNTSYLNSEKAQELTKFLESIKEEFMPAMDRVNIESKKLRLLIELAIIELEQKPLSRFCPRIYLAISE